MRIGMLLCVRKTLNIDDKLLKNAKKASVDQGVTLTKVIEDALRFALQKRLRPVSVRDLPTVAGKLRPGVSITTRDQMYQILDEPET
jgi:hypothetical protein